MIVITSNPRKVGRDQNDMNLIHLIMVMIVDLNDFNRPTIVDQKYFGQPQNIIIVDQHGIVDQRNFDQTIDQNKLGRPEHFHLNNIH